MVGVGHPTLNRYLLTVAFVISIGGLPATAVAQDAPPAAPAHDVEPARLGEEPVPTGAATGQTVEGGSAFGRFVTDVAGDYKHFFSQETAAWYVAGGGASAFVYIFDDDLSEALAEPTGTARTVFDGGDNYGNLTLQLPLVIGWWVTGYAIGNPRAVEAGRDLLRAQISGVSWNYAMKFAVRRTRPNGDPRSFPSGHATATFATAMVLQDHYGWKVGVPFFAAATYTAISRVTIKKHWASDVTMGAFVGIASARTVTLHLRNTRFAVAPYAVPHGWGVGLVAVP